MCLSNIIGQGEDDVISFLLPVGLLGRGTANFPVSITEKNDMTGESSITDVDIIPQEQFNTLIGTETFDGKTYTYKYRVLSYTFS